MQNWTKTPNVRLEAMPGMGEAELKLTAVLVRQTYGYHRDGITMTYDTMQKETGLSRGGVSNAITAVSKRGFFTRGNKSMWYINSLPNRLNDTEETEEIVYPVDQNSLPDRLKSIDQSLPSRLNQSGIKEKELKKIYIEPDTDPIAALKTAIACVAREPLWGKTEEAYGEFAYMLHGWEQTPEQVKGFAKWWAINKPPEYVGKPALTSVINRYQDYMSGITANKSNGNLGALTGV
jgi:hypothetical protein